MDISHVPIKSMSRRIRIGSQELGSNKKYYTSWIRDFILKEQSILSEYTIQTINEQY